MNVFATDPSRYLLRSAQPEDLPVLERFAVESAHGITTLPADPSALAARVARSLRAFATDDAASGEEIYLFVVEDRSTGTIVGTSGIAASAGFADRFYTFRNEFVVHASPQLGASNRIHTLHLCQDLTDVTLLTSFYIDPAHAHGVAPQLLSRGRLLFIAQFADRFSERIGAETPGLADDAGRCPFWDAVGRRFFGMDYPSVEQLAAGRSKSFIADLMPPSPIYVPLLPDEAQWAIGQLHPVGELPFSILVDEGFDPDSYVDIFDGGPTVVARGALLKTIASSRCIRLGRASAAQREVGPDRLLVATTRRDAFRATCTLADASGEPQIDTASLAALAASPGSVLRVAPLALSEPAGARA
jgi:arginine N-succinyltransferase